MTKKEKKELKEKLRALAEEPLRARPISKEELEKLKKEGRI